MNYYIQGCAAKADKIKAAFEDKGCDTTGWKFNVDGVLYYTHEGRIDLACGKFLINLIKTHPDYKELGLHKPHYDIANFHAGMPVLVRETSLNAWQYVLFSHCYIGGDGLTRFNAGLVGFTQCIPFEGNEALLGTTEMPDEMYINW